MWPPIAQVPDGQTVPQQLTWAGLIAREESERAASAASDNGSGAGAGAGVGATGGALVAKNPAVVANADTTARGETRVSRGGSFSSCNAITGLESSMLLSETVYEELCSLSVSDDGTVTEVHLTPGAFRPGSVLVFRVASPYYFSIEGAPEGAYALNAAPPAEMALLQNLAVMHQAMDASTGALMPSTPPPPGSPDLASARRDSFTVPPLTRTNSWSARGTPPPFAELEAALQRHDVTLVSLNVLLFRCDAEERDATSGKRGVYDVPG